MDVCAEIGMDQNLHLAIILVKVFNFLPISIAHANEMYDIKLQVQNLGSYNIIFNWMFNIFFKKRLALKKSSFNEIAF